MTRVQERVLLQALESEDQDERGDEQLLPLQGGRTVAVTTEGAQDIVEIRAAQGQVELRIKITEQGPVLQLDGVRLEVRAAEDIAMQCKRFQVHAEESVAITSAGEATVTAEDDLKLRSESDVRVNGEKIYLN